MNSEMQHTVRRLHSVIEKNFMIDELYSDVTDVTPETGSEVNPFERRN